MVRQQLGPDDIPYEFYKNGNEVVTDMTIELLKRVREEERGMNVE